MICKIWKAANSQGEEIILGGLGKGINDIIRNDIAKGSKADFNLRMENFSNYTKS